MIELVLTQATYDKLLSEVPKYKLITQSVLSDRLRVWRWFSPQIFFLRLISVPHHYTFALLPVCTLSFKPPSLWLLTLLPRPPDTDQRQPCKGSDQDSQGEESHPCSGSACYSVDLHKGH